MSKLNEILLKQKRITQEQFDKAQAKDTAIKEVIDEYKKVDKTKLLKADMAKLLDKLIK